MPDIHTYSPIWGVWRVDGPIGEGGSGKVYRVVREDFGHKYYAAVKLISVPPARGDIKLLMREGMSARDAAAYYDDVAKRLSGEIKLLRELRGSGNIVGYEDHLAKRKPGGIGWDILIRMELLESLDAYFAGRAPAEADVVALGLDMCAALELCARRGVIHRDIKPENIFLSPEGSYKLGDFGIARHLDDARPALSKKGTYAYMAPEVYRGAAYNASVDIYGLGLVMYRLLNGNRTPFLPPAPLPVTPADREAAIARRMEGTPLPPPAGASGALAAVILKACAYTPGDRYASPADMRAALMALPAAPVATAAPNYEKTESADMPDAPRAAYHAETDNAPAAGPPVPPRAVAPLPIKRKRNMKWLPRACVLLCVFAIFALGISVARNGWDAVAADLRAASIAVSGALFGAPRFAPDNAALVALGEGVTLAVQRNGELWAWGVDGALLGLGGAPRGTGGARYVAGGVVGVAVGREHALALTRDGVVLGWGRGESGALGGAASRGAVTPVEIERGVTAVAAGHYFSCLLKEDGTVWLAGSPRALPYAEYEGFTRVFGGARRISARGSALYVVDEGGALYGLVAREGGAPGFEHVLDGVEEVCPYEGGALALDGAGGVYRLDAGDVTLVMEDAAAIAAGDGCCFAVTEGGALYAWGENGEGQLGVGDRGYRREPVFVMEGVACVASDGARSAAVTRGGALMVWGDGALLPERVKRRLTAD